MTTLSTPDEERLQAAWSRPPGLVGWLMAVNHKDIGLRFVVTGLGFLVVGGIMALLVRTQLAVPENDFLGAETYNELFTMHGTTMMFLFAVPVLEGLGMYFLPLMLGTRDLPFPRLNAFGYWTYLFGGLFVLASFAAGEVPDAGWFAYVPLAGPEFSVDRGMDFWLLGVTFVEVAGIVGAIELLVAFLKRRAPGMTLERIPVFAWSMFVTAGMMLVAFPALVTASVLLELDRAAGTRFYDPTAGGDPLLWQHLFWFFGHPEVYIILLPAVGLVSMVVPVFARRRLAAYALVVAALVAIGVISFGLWIHHMFTVGLPLLALSFFAAASFLIVIPSGIQVFAWLATLARGRPIFATPLLFVLGFLAIFVLGGITGIMVAAVPFDWQAHDSFFVVAHFHYVLIGGMLFPLFAGLYYWFPKWTGRLLHEGLGRLSFWVMFVGFNVAFFPQHWVGLQGMPRRVYTYSSTDGWAWPNLLSTIGAYAFAVGVGLTLLNALRARRAPAAAADPWGANSLEWATGSPPPPYNFARLPVVASAEPLWDADTPTEHDDLVARLAAPPEVRREVLESSAVSATPERIVLLPGPSLWPLACALSLLLALLGVLVGSLPLGAAATAATVACAIGWVASTMAERAAPERRELPVTGTGSGLWGVALALVAGGVVLGSLVFTAALLSTGAESWPPRGASLPPLAPSLTLVVLSIGTAAAVAAAVRAPRRGESGGLTLLVAACLLALGSLAAGVWTLAIVGGDATADAYGSVTAALVGWQALLAAVVAVGLGIAAWELRRGRATARDAVSGEIAVALALGAAASAAVVALALHVLPRIV